jgi:hyperosmotically inducible periplasmic protein
MRLFLFLISLAISTCLCAQPREPRQPEEDQAGQRSAKVEAKRAGAVAKRATQNAALTGKVKSALAADVGLKTMKINVDSEGGVVTLKGHVDSADTKRRAAVTAGKVKGVTEVRNQLQVRAPRS